MRSVYPSISILFATLLVFKNRGRAVSSNKKRGGKLKHDLVFFTSHVVIGSWFHFSKKQCLIAESEKPRQRVSNADQKVFVTSSLFAEEFPDTLHFIWIFFVASRHFPNYPKILQPTCRKKLSGFVKTFWSALLTR